MLEWLRGLNALPRAGPVERRRTNRWAGARVARFATNFIGPHLLGVAAPGQLNRSAADCSLITYGAPSCSDSRGTQR